MSAAAGIGRAMESNCSTRICATSTLATLSTLALFTISCVAAAGAFPSPYMGYVAIGLGGFSIAMNLAGGNLGERKVQVIIHAVIAALYITLGALGAAGILSNVQLGWGIVGTVLSVVGLGCLIGIPVICCITGGCIELKR